MIALDSTVVNVALPSIERDLHFSSAALAWVVNAYLITFAGFLLLAGRLGDLLGHRRVFISGLIVFTIASGLCGLAQTAATLIVARMLQGVGAAALGAVLVAIIAEAFSGRARSKAIGIFTFTSVVGGSAGLLAGGVLTQTLGWNWIFFINVPIGIVVVPLSLVFIASHQGIGIGRGLDALGAVLITVALMLGCYAIVEASVHGWLSAVTLGTGTAALALVGLFVLRESTTPDPLIVLRIFRSRDVAGANIARGLLNLGLYAAFFLLTLYLQNDLHYSPEKTGLAFLPMTLLISVCSISVATRLITLIGPKRVLLLGYALVIAGLLLFSRLPAHASYLANVLPGLLLLGAGSPLGFNPAIMLAINSVPRSDLGVASGMSNISNQVGAAIGLALVATLSATRAGDLVAGGHSAASAALGGEHLAFAVTAVALVAGFIFNALMLRTALRGDVHGGGLD